MEKLKKSIIYSVITIILIVNMSVSHAVNGSNIPKHIEIGLFFGSTAKSSVNLKSNNGFEIGVFNNDEFIKLADLIDEEHIILSRDIDISKPSNNQGAYHIEIDERYNNSEQALTTIKNLRLTDRAYLAYDKGWKIFIGTYPTKEYVEKEIDRISENINKNLKIVQPSSKRVQVSNSQGKILVLYNSEENIYFRSNHQDEEAIINLDGKNYRGAITGKRLANSDMSIVNKLELEKYLYGVVPNEIPALWSMEALKAQTVAARGTAVSNINRFRDLGFDLCNTTMSQVYGGYDSEHENTNKAVDGTRGKILVYNGEIANTFYHSNSGGHTENSENIWSAAVPYIRGVKDEFSLNTTNSTWKEELSKDQIESLLEKNSIFIGDLLDLKIDSISENGRVLQLIVQGTKGQETLVKEKARTVFGLKSNWYTINDGNMVTDNKSIIIKGDKNTIKINQLDNKYIISAQGIKNIKDTSSVEIYNGKDYMVKKENTNVTNNTNKNSFVFEGRGWGHGLGMSQYGAKKMAEEGYDYIEILKHYYTGTEVK